MLVLQRKINEIIYLGSEVRIQVVDVRGDRVRLGIDAPASIPVHREEVFQEINREGRLDRSVCPCCGHKRQEVDTDAI